VCLRDVEVFVIFACMGVSESRLHESAESVSVGVSVC
jgi:hypothetical protein